jgi:hypothetical protein
MTRWQHPLGTGLLVAAAIVGGALRTLGGGIGASDAGRDDSGDSRGQQPRPFKAKAGARFKLTDYLMTDE